MRLHHPDKERDCPSEDRGESQKGREEGWTLGSTVQRGLCLHPWAEAGEWRLKPERTRVPLLRGSREVAGPRAAGLCGVSSRSGYTPQQDSDWRSTLCLREAEGPDVWASDDITN